MHTYTQKKELVNIFTMSDSELDQLGSPVSKRIFYAPLITRANHFSIVSGDTIKSPHGLYPSEGAREQLDAPCVEFW